MTKEDIIRMAREASNNLPDALVDDDDLVMLYLDELERFAALVAAASEAKEREACAKVCEAGVDYEHPTVKGHIMENFGHSRLLAKAIRSRGQA
jgi:hypothetical protein